MIYILKQKLLQFLPDSSDLSWLIHSIPLGFQLCNEVWPICQVVSEGGDTLYIQLRRCLGGRSQEEGDDVEGKDHEDKNLEYKAVVVEPNSIKEDSRDSWPTEVAHGKGGCEETRHNRLNL